VYARVAGRCNEGENERAADLGCAPADELCKGCLEGLTGRKKKKKI